LSPYGDAQRVTHPINADIAASTQKLFEETMLDAVEALHAVVERLDARTKHLCYSGGTGLNCPANSRIWREGRFDSVHVEPMTDDSGLALGAALWAYHNLLEEPRLLERSATDLNSPYYGPAYLVQTIAELAKSIDPALVVTSVDDCVTAAAKDLDENKVIGWFEGRSEVGPRALGHRSILADPRDAGNWARVNEIKGRERWRPFAPAVLEREAETWFIGGPNPAPYMLFTATVKSHALPAITHVDGSARVQTVGPGNGRFYELLREFQRRTGVPIVLNTSMNGPGEPIVETPEDALRLFAKTSLDVMYIDRHRVVRAPMIS
jgi:carbamoyltransferase